jgi:hypothetical protein
MPDIDFLGKNHQTIPINYGWTILMHSSETMVSKRCKEKEVSSLGPTNRRHCYECVR